MTTGRINQVSYEAGGGVAEWEGSCGGPSAGRSHDTITRLFLSPLSRECVCVSQKLALLFTRPKRSCSLSCSHPSSRQLNNTIGIIPRVFSSRLFAAPYHPIARTLAIRPVQRPTNVTKESPTPSSIRRLHHQRSQLDLYSLIWASWASKTITTFTRADSISQSNKPRLSYPCKL